MRVVQPTWTSSSLRIGIERTLYFWRSSLLKGDDISLRRMCDGAEKWRARFFRRDDETFLLSFILILEFPETKKRSMKLIFVSKKIRSKYFMQIIIEFPVITLFWGVKYKDTTLGLMFQVNLSWNSSDKRGKNIK